MCPDSLEEILVVFILQNECRMLWPHTYWLMAMTHMRTKETTLNDEQQHLSLPFVWRLSQLQENQDWSHG